MQRMNRSTHAPVGAALFLFLGVAILPVSLRVTGVEVSFSPRFAAAMDAWHEVAAVFGADYQGVPASELAVVKDLDTDLNNPTGSSESAPGTHFACSRQAEGDPAAEVRTIGVRSIKSVSAPRAGFKAASRRSVSSGHAAMVAAAEAIKASFEKQVPKMSAFGTFKAASWNREELLKGLDKQLINLSVEQIVEAQRSRTSKNMRVLFRHKRAVAGASPKAAERKGFSAIASARSRECERATLTGMTIPNPEHSEF